MLCLQAITETMPTEEPPAMQQQNQMMQMNQAMMAAMFAPRAPPKNPTPAPMDIAQIMAAAQAHVQARQIFHIANTEMGKNIGHRLRELAPQLGACL